MPPASETANVVLVHDGFVDGAGWLRVYIALKSQGYQVTIVQNPTISLAGDVAVTRRAIAGLQGPVILVGHSYGGVVITVRSRGASGTPRAVGTGLRSDAIEPVTINHIPGDGVRLNALHANCRA
jgi:hypothetical protein